MIQHHKLFLCFYTPTVVILILTLQVETCIVGDVRLGLFRLCMCLVYVCWSTVIVLVVLFPFYVSSLFCHLIRSNGHSATKKVVKNISQTHIVGQNEGNVRQVSPRERRFCLGLLFSLTGSSPLYSSTPSLPLSSTPSWDEQTDRIHYHSPFMLLSQIEINETLTSVSQNWP